MNLQYLVLNNKKTTGDVFLNKALEKANNFIKENKVRFTDKKIMLGEVGYYQNALPIIPESRDVLVKPNNIVKLRVNWKREEFTDVIDINKLKLQYGFNISIVDKGYTRNNFKNKETIWVVFDSENVANRHLNGFNTMFRTAIEQDAIDEYKRFKQNPKKRPLTYDKLVPNAYDLYDMVDRGEA